MNKLVLFGDSLFANVGKDRTLKFEEILTGYDVYNCAAGGWDTNDCLRKAPYIATLEPDILVISVGTNDMASWKQVPLETFTRNLPKIIETFKNSKVIYFLPPPVNEFKSEASGMKRTNEVLRQYYDVAKQICEERSVPYVDSFKVFMPLLDAGQDYHMADGVHLTDAAYEIIATELVGLIS